MGLIQNNSPPTPTHTQANLANNPLKVTVLHEAVVAHQNTAILCLSIAKDLSERSPAFSRLLSMSLCEGGLQSHESLLDKFFISDSQLWISECSSCLINTQLLRITRHAYDV